MTLVDTAGMDDTTLVAALHRALTEATLALAEAEAEPAGLAPRLSSIEFAHHALQESLDLLLDAVMRLHVVARDYSSMPAWVEADVILGEVLANDVALWRDGQAS